MLVNYAFLTLIVGLLAAAVTFGGVAAVLAVIAKLVVLIGLALFVGVLASGLARRV
jgi:uncharacterized membrane protein YtjA (UPF0391 family)